MEKIIILNKENKSSFYRKIFFLRILSFLRIKISIYYRGKKYEGYDSNKKSKINELLKMLDILNTHKRKEKYSLIYDYACDYLDNEFISNNWCKFENNMCISNRNKPKKYQVGSCCTSNLTKKTCKYFDERIKRCSIKCLGCKLYACPYLNRKGIKYTTNRVPYLKYFLSIRQKKIAKCTVFKSKEIIIKKWLKFYRLD